MTVLTDAIPFLPFPSLYPTQPCKAIASRRRRSAAPPKQHVIAAREAADLLTSSINCLYGIIRWVTFSDALLFTLVVPSAPTKQ